jgi:hypothetical protein
MAPPPEQIDTSVIEELVGLKRDRAVLTARLDRMTAEVDKVSQAVFQRVHADYQGRLAALDGSAAPLKDQARQEYVKLRRQLEEVGAQRAAALQDQEELELRHRLGEFEASEFSARSADVAQRVTGLDRDLAAVTAVRESFVAAFDSEDELTQSPPAANSANGAHVPGIADSASSATGATGLNIANGSNAESIAKADSLASLPTPPPPLTPLTPLTIEPTAPVADIANSPAEPPASPPVSTAKGGSRPRPGTVTAPPSATTLLAPDVFLAPEVPLAPGSPGSPDAPLAPALAAALAGTMAVPPAPAAPSGAVPLAPAAPAEPLPFVPPALAEPAPPPATRRPGAGTVPAPFLGGTVVLSDLPLAAAPAAPADTGVAPGGTMIVAFGRLVPLDEAAGVNELRVQPFTTIGRTRQNLIQLDAPSVSRKHAQIVLTEGGYVLRDLGSENGTFVNGDRVTEHVLAEGDRLQFGALRFSFHAA